MVNGTDYDGKAEASEQDIEPTVYPLKVKWTRCPYINFVNGSYSLTTDDADKYGKTFERRLHKKELKEQGLSKRTYHYMDRANSKNEDE